MDSLSNMYNSKTLLLIIIVTIFERFSRISQTIFLIVFLLCFPSTILSQIIHLGNKTLANDTRVYQWLSIFLIFNLTSKNVRFKTEKSARKKKRINWIFTHRQSSNWRIHYIETLYFCISDNRLLLLGNGEWSVKKSIWKKYPKSVSAFESSVGWNKKTDSRLGTHFFISSFQQKYHVKKSLTHKLNENTSEYFLNNELLVSDPFRINEKLQKENCKMFSKKVESERKKKQGEKLCVEI